MMKKFHRATSCILAFMMIIFLLPLFPAAGEGTTFSGEGTESSPYLISTKKDLLLLSDLVNDPATGSEYKGKYYRQTADIDLGAEPFNPIGNYRDGADVAFSGTYDGNYHKITGLYVTNQERRGGLFSLLTGTVTNLSVYGDISCDAENGGIAGNINSGIIQYCSFNGTIGGNSSATGGIVGQIWREGIIESCYFNGTLKNTSPTGNTGGIAGNTSAGYEDIEQHIKISSSYAVGKITANDSGNSGGIVGGYSQANADSSITYTNNYYLSTMTSGAVNGQGTNGCILLPEKGMKACVDDEMLASPYILNTRTDHFNDGYPIFEWQDAPYRFSGNGTEEKPYQIRSKEDLKKMRDLVNSTYYNSTYGNAHYIQTVDIDLGNEKWIPIGNNDGDFKAIFNGTYNGNSHSIHNLNVNESEPYAGLFGRIGDSQSGVKSVVTKLAVDGKVVSTSDYVGGICGEIAYDAQIINCSFNGSVSGNNYVGGITGKIWASGKVADCYHNGEVKAKLDAGGILGAVVNYENAFQVTVQNCYHIGNVSADENAAELVGYCKLNDDANTSIHVLNCYYLKDKTPVNGKYSSITGSSLSGTLMKYAAEDLGSAYTDPDEGQNDGYPVFLWQKEATTLGDLNNDGYLTASDVVILQNHILTRDSLTSKRAKVADMNDDGVIDVFDLVLLKRAVLAAPKPELTEWSEEEPPSDATFVESRTEYRYATKNYTTSEIQLAQPWILEDQKSEYSEYGEWSAYQESAVKASDLRQVETKIESRSGVTGYHMFYYCTQWADSPYYRCYRNFSINGDYAGYHARSSYGESSSAYWGLDKIVSVAELNSATVVAPEGYFDGTYDGYNKGSVNGYFFASDPGYLWFQGDAVTSNYDVTLYRYRDRSVKTIYTYYQLSDYSEWSTNPLTASNDMVVETRTVYRYASAK